MTTQHKINDADVVSLRQLIVAQLQDMYWAENKMISDLPGMAQKAHNPKLHEAFNKHLEETRVHVDRLMKVFKSIDATATPKKCEAMAGISTEVEHLIADTPEKSAVRDCALIVAAQKVEHYEIATYGCLRTLCRMAGYNEAADLLQATLDEEHTTNDNLTHLAESYINMQAKVEHN